MATLTLDKKRIPTGVRTDRHLRDCWRKMRVSLSRKFGESVDYVGVLEFQKNGVAHLHLLLAVSLSRAGFLTHGAQSAGAWLLIFAWWIFTALQLTSRFISRATR
jgi:hypothetical protein